MTIGEKIKELREAKGWTKRKLADELMTNYNNIRHWEVGRNEPSIFFCIQLADVFDITLDELCGRESRVRNNESL
jgi:transcriptional regulator with XRE-family HTH domain